MKLSKRQLKRIIREEKQRLQEMGSISPRPQHPMIAAGQAQAINRIGAMAGQGAIDRSVQQSELSRRFRAADVLADEPFARLQRGQQLLAGMPAGGISGGTGAQIYQPQMAMQPSPLSQIAGAAGAVGTAAAGIGAAVNSDIELKENIRRVGAVSYTHLTLPTTR